MFGYKLSSDYPILTIFLLKSDLYVPFYLVGFKCLKATEPLRGDSWEFSIENIENLAP